MGAEYLVPTSDHAWVLPSGGRVFVAMEDGTAAALSGLHIVSVLGPVSVSDGKGN